MDIYVVYIKTLDLEANTFGVEIDSSYVNEDEARERMEKLNEGFRYEYTMDYIETAHYKKIYLIGS